ncbi:hypothetical protein [Paenibacillus sp. QZ-Y1]|uniref:hypothetical protein n=1 Tax=Paenibacillus sp. QZ-Y1 TaxID=3414511 RepID=UPI003F79391A
MNTYTMMFRDFLSGSSKPEGEDIYDSYFKWLLEKGVSNDSALSEVATILEVVANLMD